MTGFSYECPADWASASRMLAEPGAIAKMGGCDVLTRFRQGKLDARHIVGLHRLPSIEHIEVDSGRIRIGAGVTIAKLAASLDFRQNWPLFSDVYSTIASPAIRSSATVIGNIAQGWSVSDIVPLFQISDAVLELRSDKGERSVSLNDFTQGLPRESLGPGEIIASVEMSLPESGTFMSYERFSMKNAFDLPLVSIALAVRLNGQRADAIKVSCVGASRLPVRLTVVEEALVGTVVDDQAIEAAAAMGASAVSPINDFRASGAYRQHLVTTLLRRALRAAVNQRGGLS